MDDFLDEQRGRNLNIYQLMDGSSSRAHARVAPGAHGSHTDAPTGAEIETQRRARMDAQGNTLPGKEGEMAMLEEASEGESEGDIEEHPFFDGLKEKPKEEEWDAETILSTYTTTDHHPTMIHAPRRVRPKSKGVIQLDKKTGLPIDTMLPAQEERAAHAAALAAATGGGGAAADEGEGEDAFDEEFEQINLGEARAKGESAEDKKARKAAAKELQAERRRDKKGTKLAFKDERVNQAHVAKATQGIKGSQSLSR